MKLVTNTKRIARRLELAGRAALLSTHRSQRHGAILVKGGSILSVGCNHPDFSKHAGLHRDYTEYNVGSLHAEIAALRGLPKNVTQGSIAYVVRLGNVFGEFRMSMPCQMCLSALYVADVKRVVFSVNATDIASVTPGEYF